VGQAHVLRTFDSQPAARVARGLPTSLDAMRTLLSVSVLVILTGCGEYQETAYADLAAAKADGAVERGWIPKWVPETSVKIQEAHDLDTNQSALALQFSPEEHWSPPPSCKQVTRHDLPARPTRPSWWPADVPPSAIVTHRHAYFACEENSFVAVSQSQGELFHWRPHGI
jgi:hypothetical protein